MAKRIRHLEFYGYSDQNKFNPPTNIDLSDIREKNNSQDKEINEISGETKGKADKSVVDDLIGKFDTFNDEQVEFNEEVIDALKRHESDIVTLSGITDDIYDDIDDVINDINILSGDVETLKNDVSNISASTQEISEKLGKKLDIEVAEATYMPIVSAYTKDEIDIMASKIDSLEEAIEELSGDTDDYATKEELYALSSETISKINDVNDDITEIDNSIESISSSINDIQSNVSELSGETQIKIADLEELIHDVDENLSNSIQTLSGNTTDHFNEVEAHINGIVEVLDTKAKKSDVEAINGVIDTLSSKLDTEIVERQESDAIFGEKIDTVSGKVETLNTNYNSLRNDLNEEITARENGDNAIIGHEGDGAASITLYGTRAYAKSMATSAYENSKTYTDGEIYELSALTNNRMEAIERDLNNKANSGDVQTYVTSKIQDSETALNNAILNEQTARENEDAEIRNELDDLREQIISSSDTKAIYDRINLITTYSGGSAEEYIDSGNGILDVLHREFHQFLEEAEIYVNPTLIKLHKYESAFGHYNISHTSAEKSGRTVFSIGIGEDDDHRKNALEIMEDGSIYMWVEGEFMPINNLLAMLAHETYPNDDTNNHGGGSY